MRWTVISVVYCVSCSSTVIIVDGASPDAPGTTQGASSAGRSSVSASNSTACNDVYSCCAMWFDYIANLPCTKGKKLYGSCDAKQAFEAESPACQDAITRYYMCLAADLTDSVGCVDGLSHQRCGYCDKEREAYNESCAPGVHAECRSW